jgi:hypothetical protein
MEPELTDENRRFMEWMEEDVVGHSATPVPDEWHALKQQFEQLGSMVQSAFPADLEPPGGEAFNTALRKKLDA